MRGNEHWLVIIYSMQKVTVETDSHISSTVTFRRWAARMDPSRQAGGIGVMWVGIRRGISQGGHGVARVTVQKTRRWFKPSRGLVVSWFVGCGRYFIIASLSPVLQLASGLKNDWYRL